MAKLATIHPKSNGQVFPTDEDLSHLPGVVPADEEIENTNIQIPVFYGDAGTENNFVQKNALHPLFSAGEGKEKDEAHSSKKTKKEGRKLKTFEIFKFADQLDILLIIIGSIAALSTGAATPLMMWIFQGVMNNLISLGAVQSNATSASASDQCAGSAGSMEDPFAAIKGTIKWFITLGVTTLVIYWVAYSFWMITAERQIRRIRYALFESIMKQEMGWFDCRNAGELSGRLVEDLEIMREGIGLHLAEFLSIIARVIASIVFSLCTGWKLTLVFLSISPLILLTIVILIKVVVRYTTMELQAYSTANAIAQEVLGAIRTVTAFGGQKKEGDRYQHSLIEGKRVGIRKGFMLGATQALVSIVLYGGIAIIFWYGPYLIRTECQNYSAGQWIVIFMSCLTATFSLASVLPNLQSFAEASGSGAYVFEIIERQSKIDVTIEQGDIPSTFTGDIEFQNVHFTYPSRKEAPILNGLTMRIPSGKTVALCGSSGCGKSTSIQLIQRLYEPDQGRVTLDGRDVRSLNLKWLRSHIGVVSQEPVLFSGSIEKNIRFGKPGATDDEIIAAAKMANAHDFIMQLPQNYKTSSGDKLSGGQKQRVAIARALVSNPKILLLDEATSALDNAGERLVQDALDRAKQGRTTIVIAHRLSTIRNADLIVSLDRGNVVEYGTHEQLLAKKGLYYELVHAQTDTDKKKEKEDEHDDEDEEQLAAEIKTRHHHHPAGGDRGRRQSILSIKSQSSEISHDDLDVVDPKEKRGSACCRWRVPFIWKVAQLNGPEWVYLLIGAIASLIFGAVMPAFSLIFSEVFGALAEPDPQKQEEQIRTYTFTIFLVGVGGALCQLISSSALGKSGEELTVRMRGMSFRSMLKQEIGWFDLDENNLGALVTRLSSDAASLKGLTGQTLGAILNALGALLFALVVTFTAGWKLTLVLFSFTPLMIFTGTVRGKQDAKKFGAKDSPTTDVEEGGKHATQAIENIRTVVSLHQEEHFIRLYRDAFDRHFKSELCRIQYTSFSNSLANSLMYFLNALAFGYGIDLVQSKEMEFQNVFKVFNVITFASMSMGRSASMIPNYSKGKASAQRILLLNARPSQIDPDEPAGVRLSKVEGNVEFRDVRFRYPARPRLPILRRLNLKCPSGVTSALVGPSGSGKSTTVGLLLRFYDPLAGQVLLDGHDVRSLNIQWLRSLIGLVQQEPVLFNLSIRENIAYGDTSRQITHDQIEAAAKKANIHSLITSLPQGYDTSCGAKGGQLSGGQKQRIAIARALVRSPKLPLLDEATSALDNKSERVVQEALDQAKQGRTCLTIAHRLTTIQNSEQICVVDRGQIKERGTHPELLQQQGIYHKLTLAQQRTET